MEALPLLFSEESNVEYLKNLGSQQLFPSIKLRIAWHYTFPALITFIIKRLLLRMEAGFSIHVHEAEITCQESLEESAD